MHVDLSKAIMSDETHYAMCDVYRKLEPADWEGFNYLKNTSKTWREGASSGC
jgi:hypothetical protein